MDEFNESGIISSKQESYKMEVFKSSNDLGLKLGIDTPRTIENKRVGNIRLSSPEVQVSNAIPNLN